MKVKSMKKVKPSTWVIAVAIASVLGVPRRVL